MDERTAINSQEGEDVVAKNDVVGANKIGSEGRIRPNRNRHHGSNAVFLLIDYLFLAVFFGFLFFFLLQIGQQ